MAVQDKHSGCNLLMTSETVCRVTQGFSFSMTLLTALGKGGMQNITNHALSAAAMRAMAGKTVPQRSGIIRVTFLQITGLVAGKTNFVWIILQ
jgi:hypothetical protein